MSQQDSKMPTTEIERDGSPDGEPSEGIVDLQGLPPSVAKKIAMYQLIYSLTGVILGFVCIIGGIILFLAGVTGSSQWIVNLVGSDSKLSNAAPGAILFVVGLFIVLVTRYRVKAKK